MYYILCYRVCILLCYILLVIGLLWGWQKSWLYSTATGCCHECSSKSVWWDGNQAGKWSKQFQYICCKWHKFQSRKLSWFMVFAELETFTILYIYYFLTLHNEQLKCKFSPLPYILVIASNLLPKMLLFTIMYLK